MKRGNVEYWTWDAVRIQQPSNTVLMRLINLIRIINCTIKRHEKKERGPRIKNTIDSRATSHLRRKRNPLDVSLTRRTPERPSLDPLIPELINLAVRSYDKLHNEAAQSESKRTKSKRATTDYWLIRSHVPRASVWDFRRVEKSSSINGSRSKASTR